MSSKQQMEERAKDPTCNSHNSLQSSLSLHVTVILWIVSEWSCWSDESGIRIEVIVGTDYDNDSLFLLWMKRVLRVGIYERKRHTCDNWLVSRGDCIWIVDVRQLSAKRDDKKKGFDANDPRKHASSGVMSINHWLRLYKHKISSFSGMKEKVQESGTKSWDVFG